MHGRRSTAPPLHQLLGCPIKKGAHCAPVQWLSQDVAARRMQTNCVRTLHRRSWIQNSPGSQTRAGTTGLAGQHRVSSSVFVSNEANSPATNGEAQRLQLKTKGNNTNQDLQPLDLNRRKSSGRARPFHTHGSPGHLDGSPGTTTYLYIPRSFRRTCYVPHDRSHGEKTESPLPAHPLQPTSRPQRPPALVGLP